ncbi:RagB/SusD family nutrient uptake outer membrane protein [Aquiflexum lacus]|uniref:RagB/SusD family nutrient uptake outer membrane protein n=1 Tax=Aquiflexum lacus TaxID=2483805 RepID=UPI0018946A10|nr:RagB/SusD family nutrient uptake outer membrane protein [Aquiflexum lacus]
MKKYIFILIMIFGTSGCDDFLIEQNVSDISYEFYDTEDGIEALVWASYTHLRSFGGSQEGLKVSNHGTDIWTFTNVSDGNEFHTYTTDISPVNGNFNNLWNAFYKGINSCNIAINRIPTTPSSGGVLRTEEGRNARIGEVRFLRAFYYFTLVQMFGKIPLLLEENIEVLDEMKRESVANVYNAIIEDLRIASKVLPNSQSENARPTKAAAQHLLAKVYLTRGSAVSDQRGQQSFDMDSAAFYAQKVITARGPLLPDYDEARRWQNQRNKEVLFAVEYSQNRLVNGSGNPSHRFYVIQYETVPGMARDVPNDVAWVRLRPSDLLYDLYDRKNDSRFYKSFKTTWIANRANNIPLWTTENAPSPELVGQRRFTVGDTALYVSFHKDVPPSAINQTRYRWLPRERFTDRLFPQYRYFMDPNRLAPNDNVGTLNFKLLWLSETYLIAAEAFGRLGDFGQAADYINQVRLRAAYKEGEEKPAQFFQVEGGSIEELTKSTENEMLISADMISSPISLINFILEERAREMPADYMRWFDLVRTETFFERVTKYNPSAAPLVRPFHKLRPIPQNHIDRLRNAGPIEEEQNEGYY